MDQDQILSLAIAADDTTLFALLGKAVVSETSALNAGSEDFENLGKNWFAAKNKEDGFRRLICRHPKVAHLIVPADEDTSETRDAILLVADLLASIVGGVPAIFVSILVLRIGIKKWCNADLGTKSDVASE